MRRGGGVKVFDRGSGALHVNDSGIIGHLKDGRIATSQWVGSDFECQGGEQGWKVHGYLQVVPRNAVFTPLKNVLFRVALLALGWNGRFPHFLKGRIRKALITASRPVPIRFERSVELDGDVVLMTDRLRLEGSARFSDVAIGGSFSVRHVPQ